MSTPMRTRPYRVEFYMNEEENARLRELAERTGLTLSGVLRAMLAGYQLQERPTAELLEFNRQLTLIGNNLNQIAAKANAQGLIDAAYYRDQADALNDLRLNLYERLLLPRKGE